MKGLNVERKGIIIVTIDYDVNVMTSYEMSDYVDELFGAKNVQSFEEIRDCNGYLKQFKMAVSVELHPRRTNKEREAKWPR